MLASAPMIRSSRDVAGAGHVVLNPRTRRLASLPDPLNERSSTV